MQKRFDKLALLALLPAFAIGAFSTGCEKQGATVPADQNAGVSAQAAVPAGFVLSEAPADARDLATVKGALKDGDDVVVRAVVGGSEHPFVNNRAVVQVIDLSVTTCDKTPGDSCKTPWDACCDQDNAKAKSATIQVADSSGSPMKGTLEGVGGLSH